MAAQFAFPLPEPLHCKMAVPFFLIFLRERPHDLEQPNYRVVSA